MGWISKRKMETGHGIGSYNKNSPKHGAPLRKIVEVLRVTSNMFEQDYVILECGHKTHSNGAFRARCVECKKLAEGKDGAK